jgi:MFS family permease
MQTNRPRHDLVSQDHAGQYAADHRPIGRHGVFALVKPSPRRLVLIAVFLSSLAFGLLFQLFPPLLAVIARQFQVNRSLSSLVMTLFLVPILLIAFPAGALVSRYGVRLMGQLAFGWLVAGTSVCIVAPTFAVLLLGRVISGVGGGLLMIALLTLITESIPRTEQGLALGLFVAGLPAGTGIAFDLLAQLGSRLGWRGELGTALLIVLGAFLVFWGGIPTRTRSTAPFAHLGAVVRQGQMWRLALVTLLGYTAIIGFTTWGPTTLVTFARVPLWVGTILASILLVIDIPFAPLWGAISDRLGRRKPFIVAGFTVYLIGSLLVPIITHAGTLGVVGLLITITAMGGGCAMFFPAALAMPAELVQPEQVGLAYAMLFMAQVGGMLLGPILIGTVLDFGFAGGALLSVSALTLLGLLVGVTLHGR